MEPNLNVEMYNSDASESESETSDSDTPYWKVRICHAEYLRQYILRESFWRTTRRKECPPRGVRELLNFLSQKWHFQHFERSPTIFWDIKLSLQRT